MGDKTMSRGTGFGILGVIVLIIMLALGSCGVNTDRGIDRTGAGDYVDYYGCPNSRRVKKLNLAKKKR